jgi:hypothetical protein
MGGFSITENPLRTIWAPVSYNNATASTVYVGQFVVCGYTASCSGVKPWVLAGHADTTADQVPFGIVRGLDVYPGNGSYSATYSSEYVTSVRTQAAQVARNAVFKEGMIRKGDPSVSVQVEVLSTNSIIRGPIFNATYGTAITVAPATVASTDGTALTTAAYDFTPVAYNNTWYCRSGANAGLYRIGYDTSTTTHTFYGPDWPFDIAIGDKFVAVPFAIGAVKMCFDAVSMFVDSSAGYGTNDIWVDVIEINLEEAGKEYVLFRLNPLQLLSVRA